MPKEKLSYEHIISSPEISNKEKNQELKDVLEEKDKGLAKFELKKTPDDIKTIEQTDSIVNNIIKGYGCDSKKIPLDHIYILKPGSVATITGNELSEGIHRPIGINIGVEKKESKFLFAATIAHELFHAKSPKTIRIEKTPTGEHEIHLYRSGIEMVGKKDEDKKPGKEKAYFTILEEAIVAECTKKFLNEISKVGPYREDAKAVEKLKNWLIDYRKEQGVSDENLRFIKDELRYIDNPQERVKKIMKFYDDKESRQAYAAGMITRLIKEKEIEIVERYKERKMLYNLLDKIVEKSNGQFKNREAIFSEFAKANFTGNYLSIAPIVENALGKGSFRELANKFGTERKNKNNNTD
ncbi:MAG: hypothetical protein M1334_04345 [Patescibacteria group bacterium]|nr:hypothetical protein [Patescibacteria group bacterium]